MTSRLLPLSFFALMALPALSWGRTAPTAATTTTPAAATSASSPIVIHDSLPSAPATVSAPFSGDGGVKDDLGSTQLREAARIKAQIDLEKLKGSLEDAQRSRILAERKFTDDLAGKKDGDKNNTKGATLPLTPVAPKPYATSYYNFGGDSSARLMFNGAQFVVSQGTVLPNGAKVETVSDSNVILRQAGRKIVVPYLGGAVGW